MANEETFVLDWAKLTAPVPAEDVEWVEKAAGKKFPYMTAQFLRRRLDSVAQGRWSYQCQHVPFVQGQPAAGDGEPFVVKGVLSIQVGTGYNWRTIERESIGSGKNFKEAETDAFKRAAQRLGIGNELYEMDSLPTSVSPAKPTLVIPRGPAGNTPKAGTASDTPVPSCPVCNGRMWDNRENKRNPKSPDFKCRDRSCDGVVWRESDLEKPVTKEGLDQEMEKDGKELPF